MIKANATTDDIMRFEVELKFKLIDLTLTVNRSVTAYSANAALACAQNIARRELGIEAQPLWAHVYLTANTGVTISSFPDNTEKEGIVHVPPFDRELFGDGAGQAEGEALDGTHEEADAGEVPLDRR